MYMDSIGRLCNHVNSGGKTHCVIVKAGSDKDMGAVRLRMWCLERFYETRGKLVTKFHKYLEYISECSCGTLIKELRFTLGTMGKNI